MTAPISTTSDVELAAIGAEAGPKIEDVRRTTDRFWAADDAARNGIDTLIHHERLRALFDRAITLQAATLDDVKAKLMLVRWQLEVEFRTHGRTSVDEMSPAERMASSLCDDLLGPVQEAVA